MCDREEFVKEAGEVAGFLQEVEQSKRLLATNSEMQSGESPRHDAAVFSMLLHPILHHRPYCLTHNILCNTGSVPWFNFILADSGVGIFGLDVGLTLVFK